MSQRDDDFNEGWRAATETMTAGVNPKAVAARSKVPLDLLEPEAEVHIARALEFGADRYGRQNYLTIPVHMRTYLAAMRRHIDAVLSGEDVADDSQVDHLGHVGAGVHIILAARKNGNLVDDRGPAERTAEQEEASSTHNVPGGHKPDPSWGPHRGGMPQ